MKKAILTLIGCTMLAACATDNLAETGISRSRAISIAESNCSAYPDRFSYVDRAEWNPNSRHWEVTLADRYGYKGERFTISRAGHVISEKKFTDDRYRPYRGYGRDEYYGDRPYHYWGWY